MSHISKALNQSFSCNYNCTVLYFQRLRIILITDFQPFLPFLQVGGKQVKETEDAQLKLIRLFDSEVIGQIKSQ